MDENTLTEQAMVAVVVCVIAAFLVFAPVLGDMLIDFGWQAIVAHFQ